jgi:hypothetical protein
MFDAWQRHLEKSNPRAHTLPTSELEYLWSIIMAGKKKTGAPGKGGYDGWKGFANVSLSDADKTAIRSTQISDDELFDCLQTVMSQGHKITLYKKEGKEASVVSFTGASDGCPNKGYTLSSFAPTLRDAIIVNYYKHHYICQDTWKDLTDDTEADFG